MKRLRLIVIICFVLSAVLLAATTIYSRMITDKTLPVISVPENILLLSVKDYSDEALLQGVTAYDEKDGDLTEHVRVQSVIRQQANQMKVTYSVCDGDNHVSTASRIVDYYDFTPPRFHLTAPLRYNLGNTIQVMDRLTATDVLDGDITDRIRVNATGLSTYSEGTYPVTFEVSNSFGDASSLTLNVTVSRTVYGAPTIELSEYIVYIRLEDDFDPMDYVTDVKDGELEDVTAKLPRGGFVEGVNEVEFTCKGETGVRGSTVMFVVAE